MRIPTSVVVASWGLILCLTSPPAADARHRVTVSAGEFDRRGTVARIDVPKDVAAGEYLLKDDAGNAVPAQVVAGGQAWLRVDLKAGEAKTFTLVPAPQAAADSVPVQVDELDDVITVRVDRRDAMRYQGQMSPLPEGYDPALQRGGYIHPVFTPSGKPVTDDYPHNHKHHHGIWAPWTKTEFEGRHPDFWNMAKKTGTVEFVSCGDLWSGSLAGGFRARHRFVDLTATPQPKPVLDEQWDVVVSTGTVGDTRAHVLDLTITQTCATDTPLVLPKYHYGGLGFRGHKQWDGKANCFFLTSERKDRGNGNETTGRWCHVGGKVDGELAGVAVLCHPDNFRFPQPMRLHPDEPFFCYAPSLGGDWRIEPGKPYVARYRFVVADGPPVKEEIERLWNDYAHPPTVEVE